MSSPNSRLRACARVAPVMNSTDQVVLTSFSSTLVFYVNGKKVEDDEVDPEWTLLYYLRKKLKLTGSKLGCGEGGCGACTVMISRFDRTTKQLEHMAVNACLTPVAAVHGQAVTTIEGIGNVTKGKIHDVQARIAQAHGSQCGFCTPGIVMSMYTLIRSQLGKPSWEQLMEAFQGNLCRCTGYRPILDAYREFTKEAQGMSNGTCALGNGCCKSKSNGEPNSNGAQDESDQERRCTEDVGFSDDLFSQEIIFPPDLVLSHKAYGVNLIFKGPRIAWYRPTELADLLKLKSVLPASKIVSGNTEIGIEVKFKNCLYPTLIYPNYVKELNEITIEQSVDIFEGPFVKIGAVVSLTRVASKLSELVNSKPEPCTRVFREILKMLKVFAGKQIRNMGTVAGTIMTGSPISDLNPVLMAAAAKVELHSHGSKQRLVTIDQKFWTGYRTNIVRPDEVVTAVYLPFTNSNEHFKCYKQSRRREDDIAIVNAAYFIKMSHGLIEDIRIAYGGMAATTKLALKTAACLKELPLNDEALELAFASLGEELPLDSAAPGGMIPYRRALVLSLFLQFYNDMKLFPRDESILFEEKPHSESARIESVPMKSSQYFTVVPATQTKTDLVGRPIVHLSAFKQASGEAIYCDDIPTFDNELHLAFVLSTRPHAKILSIDASKALSLDGVEAFISARDLPAERNNCGAIVHDEEVFASKKVVCQGQIIGCIVGSTLAIAQRSSKLVEICYEDLEPKIITIEEAIEQQSYFSEFPVVERRGDVTTATRRVVANGGKIVEGQVRIGGQEHFYLETQNSIAVPSKEDNEITIYAASQHPSEVQRQVALVLGLPFNRVVCKVKRIGGGFGGKEVRSCMLAIPVAVAAHKLGRPVRMSLDRDEDMMISGQRHPFIGRYKAACTSEGRVEACHFQLYSNGGCSLDLSDAVMERAMLHVSNCSNIPNILCEGFVCRTNLPSNTAFRGFGAPQAMFIGETMLQHVAHSLAVDINKVHEMSFYKHGDTTYFGQELSICNIRRCWDECLLTSQLTERRLLADKFNREHKYLKRGLSVIPTMFGIAFSTPFLNQAGALILVYRDGSVLVSHGGTEMGQGLHTKMIQVVSRAFGISADLVHISETSTDKVPNSSATAGSASSDLNGMAILNACGTIMRRLEPVISKNPKGTWVQWVDAAYFQRISLAVTGFYKLPDMGRDSKTGLGNTFSYFTYGAACSEVEVNCLTGHHQVLRTDIVMDLGQSLNPAIDIGQVEGAFMQGLGLFTLEQVLVSPSGGLLTRGPGAYKIPSFGDIPAEFNVSLLKDSSNLRAIYSSKAVGEPPLFLASSIFFALKDAISTSRSQNGNHEWFRIDSPATAADIRMLMDDDIVKQVSKVKGRDCAPWGLQP